MSTGNPTDHLQYEKLSELGKILIDKRPEIIQAWKADIRRENSHAAVLDSPILIDTLPALIDNLAESLSPDYPRSTAVEDSTIAEEHGGERARLSNYNLGDLITEYQVLKEVTLAKLSEVVALTIHDLRIIHSSFNIGLRESATSFALVHTQIREQFVATLTHDLRNPLNSISMASQLLQTENMSHDAKSLVIKICENAQRMDRMIQDLLDVTYVRSGGRLSLRISETCIFQIVKEVVSAMTLSEGRKFEVLGKSVVGCWDAEALRRSVENLVSNAIKYGDRTRPITIKVAENGGRMILKVHNEGEPIPLEEQETIFQAYRRVHGTSGKKGWGIGLPLVRAVAEAHGGSLALDSAYGRGTTFIIDIPIDSRPYQNSPAPHQ